MYLLRLDGSEGKLLAQLDHWMAFSVLDTDQFQPMPVSGFVRVESCRFVPLQGLMGTIEQWIDP